ncbi:MAG: hypothetical protein ABR861_00360 [Terriglobales bacterium]
MTLSPLLLSAREIAAQIRRKAVSPVDVARAHLESPRDSKTERGPWQAPPLLD